MYSPEATLQKRGKKREAQREGGNLDGPVLVCSISHFSYFKLTLLNRTEDWTVHGVFPKKKREGGRDQGGTEYEGRVNRAYKHKGIPTSFRGRSIEIKNGNPSG